MKAPLWPLSYVGALNGAGFGGRGRCVVVAQRCRDSHPESRWWSGRRDSNPHHSCSQGRRPATWPTSRRGSGRARTCSARGAWFTARSDSPSSARSLSTRSTGPEPVCADGSDVGPVQRFEHSSPSGQEVSSATCADVRHGRGDSNSQPTVLETVALPVELRPCVRRRWRVG
jgi:hypothetical protein